MMKRSKSLNLTNDNPIFSWSPLPQKKELDLPGKLNKSLETLSKQDKYYPSCDVNVWLRSCEQEIVEPLHGHVKGTIPKWLNGCLIRNGPGSLRAGKEYFGHLFDSSALLHRFAIENGQITYQCRFVQSESYKKNWAANRIVSTEFGTRAIPDPCHTIFQKVAALFDFKNNVTDNSLISVYPFCDELYAFNEGPMIHRIDPQTLATEGRVDVSEHVAIVNHTSHPHVMNDGTVYNIGISVHRTGPHHSIIMFPAKEAVLVGSASTMFDKAEVIARIPARWPLHPSYMHTFGITENYFILVEQPLNVSATAIIATKLKNEPLIGSFRWHHDEMTQIDVIDRKTGALAYKFYADAFFYLHIINQYELDDDYIVLDICIYRDPAMIECMYIETMKTMHQNPNYAKMFRGRPARFVMPLKAQLSTGNVNLIRLLNTDAEAYFMDNGEIYLNPERLCDLGCETPRIHYEKYLGRKYRYFYAISSDVDAANPGTIIKVDTITKTVRTWCEDNCYPSEPIFVPAPNPTCEDDGVILASMVWGWGDVNHAGLVILDARTYREIGRAEFRTPGPVPKCLHGWYLPDRKRQAAENNNRMN